MRRYEERIAKLRQAVLASRGQTEPALRLALAERARGLALGAATSNEEIPENLRPFVDRVARAAYEVTDEAVLALQRSGYSDDQLFEIIAATAVGAGEARYEAGMKALEEARK